MDAKDLDIDAIKASPISEDLERVLSLLPPGVLGRSNSWSRRRSGSNGSATSHLTSHSGTEAHQTSPLRERSSYSQSPRPSFSAAAQPHGDAERATPNFKGGSVVLDAAGDIYVDDKAPASAISPQQRPAASPARTSVSVGTQSQPMSPADKPAASAPPDAAKEKTGRRVQPEEVRQEERVLPLRFPAMSCGCTAAAAAGAVAAAAAAVAAAPSFSFLTTFPAPCPPSTRSSLSRADWPWRGSTGRTP